MTTIAHPGLRESGCRRAGESVRHEMAYPLALQLRNAYAFGTMGTITGIAAIAAFIAAAVMLVLGGLGLMHGRHLSRHRYVHQPHRPHTGTG